MCEEGVGGYNVNVRVWGGGWGGYVCVRWEGGVVCAEGDGMCSPPPLQPTHSKTRTSAVV